MKIYKIFINALFFAFLSVNVFGQTKSYSFVVQKTGQGKQVLIFIPGFACSGEVWNDTKIKFENILLVTP